MVDSDVFVQALENMGVNFFTGVPDSLLGGIIEELLTRKLYTSAVRQDEAVAMGAGAFMAGKIPAVLMQNSGLGTSLNTLLSLNMIYRQPCLLLVSWRGFEGKDAPEHLVMGETMPQLLDTMRIPGQLHHRRQPGRERRRTADGQVRRHPRLRPQPAGGPAH